MISRALCSGRSGTSRLSSLIVRASPSPSPACTRRSMVSSQQAQSRLAARLGDQVLADLDADMRQAPALAVHRQGVVGKVVHRIGQLVADIGRAVLAHAGRASGPASLASRL